MMQSLLIKLGMLTVTVAVVFWIGWSVPVQPERGIVAPTGVGQQKVPTPEGVSTVSSGAASMTSSLKSAGQQRPFRLPEKLDLNRATAAELESLPGIGAVLASRILEYRQTVGGFQKVEQLRQVKGIGAKKYDRVRALLEVTPATKPDVKGNKTT